MNTSIKVSITDKCQFTLNDALKTGTECKLKIPKHTLSVRQRQRGSWATKRKMDTLKPEEAIYVIH